MIEVFLGKYQDYRTILVDADDAAPIHARDGAENDTLLVLTKMTEAGPIEVAWFSYWSHAVNIDSLMEYVDE